MSPEPSVIRAAGLLDGCLDAAIAAKDMQAYVYPLKTGDLIWQVAEGKWQAGTVNQFSQFIAARKDPHLSVAADTISEMRVVDAEARTWLSVPVNEEGRAASAGAAYDDRAGRWYAPTDAVAKRTVEWQSVDAAVTETAQRETAEQPSNRVAGPVAGSRQGNAEASIVERANKASSYRDVLERMSTEDLVRSARTTVANLSAIPKDARLSAEAVARKVSLTQELTTLGAVLKDRGVDHSMIAENTHDRRAVDHSMIAENTHDRRAVDHSMIAENTHDRGAVDRSAVAGNVDLDSAAPNAQAAARDHKPKQKRRRDVER